MQRLKPLFHLLSTLDQEGIISASRERFKAYRFESKKRTVQANDEAIDMSLPKTLTRIRKNPSNQLLVSKIMANMTPEKLELLKKFIAL